MTGEFFSAGWHGAVKGGGNVYKAATGVVTAPSQFGRALGKEIGDYAYLPDEFDARWAERRAMLAALINDPCYRQQALEALKRELGESIADGALFANIGVDALTSLAGIGVTKQLDRLNELMKLGKLPKPGVAANRGLSVASPAGGEVLSGSVLRTINKGESVAGLIDEAKTITHLTGNEVAAVSLQNGQRVLVQGGRGGISLEGLNVRRILGHTQPTTPFSAGPVVPSSADIQALQQLGQRHSYIYERGQLIRFGNQ